MNRLFLIPNNHHQAATLLRRGCTKASSFQGAAMSLSIRHTAPSIASLSASSSSSSTTTTSTSLSAAVALTSQTGSHHFYSTSTPALKIESNTTGISQAELEAQLNQAIQEAEQEELSKYNSDWKPGYRKKPLSFAHTIEEFDNEHQPDTWMPNLNKRCGALGIKLGMMPVWDQWGERHACTVLYLDSNVVLKTFTLDKDGYMAVQIGAGHRKKKNVNKPLLGHFKKHGIDIDQEHVHPPFIVREFKITHPQYALQQGSQIHARHFTPGQNVDVSALSKGKGFQGAMKRWNFSGMTASHGNSKSHRALGSTGQCQDPGRVFKGKKMAGRMGNVRATTQNLRIVKIDRGRNLIYVKGPVPGQKGNFVEIRDAIKKPLFGTDKVEDQANFPPLPTFEFDEQIDGSGQAGFELMMPQQKEDPFDPPDDEAA